jgi:hypothetical protein
MKFKNLLLIGLFSVSFAIPNSFAQESSGQEDSDDSVSGKKKRKKRRRKKRRKKHANQESVNPEKSNGGGWFPDWSPEEFDWTIGPIVGFKISSTTSEEGTVNTSSQELGLRAGLSGIPVVPKNPGLTIGTNAGIAKGNIITTNTSSGIDVDSLSYTRSYGDLYFVMPVKFYRHSLILSRGKKVFDDDFATKIQSFGVTNDLGILFKGWLSGHITNRYLTVFENKFAEPVLVEQDTWLHAIMKFDVLSTMLNFGPGVVYNNVFTASDASEYEEIAKGESTYFKANSSFRLFWKIGMDAGAKYIITATEEQTGSYAQVDLPEAGLNTPRSTSMPEDSVLANAIFGIPNLFGGIGLGWVYNLQILNLSRRNGSERVTTKDNGFRIFFSAQF